MVSVQSLFIHLGTGLIVSVVDPQPGERILDCCAAPGGKTLFLASCLDGQGNTFGNVGLGTLVGEVSLTKELCNMFL